MRRLWLFALLSCFACANPSGEAPQKPATAKVPLAEGRLLLDSSVSAQADPLAVAFVIARNQQGQIVAVKKLYPPFQYPVAFALTDEDAMIQGTELSGKLKLTARLDKDGNANPAQPGDILGKADREWVPAGSRDVTINLNEVVK